jgi:hypothetical protein
MTENQKNLIIFVHKYHNSNGIIPSLTEIVKGISVSDNKSALRAIKSLVNKGYLAQVGAKKSAVIPTDKALKELNLYPLKAYTVNSQPPNIEQPRDLARDEAALTLESGFIDSGFELRADGTQFDSNQLKNIVQSAVNFALANRIPGKLSLTELFRNLPVNLRTEWILLAIFTLAASVLIFGQHFIAIVATTVILFAVFIITNLSK